MSKPQSIGTNKRKEGGTGGGSEPSGRSMSMKRFLENLSKNNQSGMMQALSGAKLEVKQARFTINGNSVRSQEAVLESGKDKVSVRFLSSYEPTQVIKPNKPIYTTIEVVSYKNGNATAIRTLSEMKTKSLKNAKKNYEKVLEEWKKITKQKSINFR